jgi:membrane protein HdeD
MSDSQAATGRPDPVAQRVRSGWDIGLGILLIIGGAVIVGDVALATAISVRLIGWVVLIVGTVMVVGSLRRIRSGGPWSAVLGGVGLAVLGLFILRNPLIGALSLTLLAGSLFLTTGLVRIFSSGQYQGDRWFVLIIGVVSVGLGLFVLSNLVTASLTLLGLLLGGQTLIEGITLLVAGRVRPDPTAASARA